MGTNHLHLVYFCSLRTGRNKVLPGIALYEVMLFINNYCIVVLLDCGAVQQPYFSSATWMSVMTGKNNNHS
jgi:hypothetical protein